MAPYIAQLIRAQVPRPSMYAEPFAGGAGAALRLLVDDVVEAIHINDLDPGIAAFWRCVFGDAKQQFVEIIRNTPATIDEWERQRAIYLTPEGRPDLEIGFAAFYLNRCNRSGILTARPIGGLDQTGTWKIDARYNRDDLIGRINYLSSFRHRVTVTQQDAREFLRSLAPLDERVLVYVDPPYITQGELLYLDKLSYSDHQQLAAQLTASELRWFMTYDCDDRITDELYPNLRCARFDIAHTAQRQHVGSEYAVFSDNLIVSGLQVLPRGDSEWVVI